jgi:glutamate-ammonia-ligase adenylyltransferase
LNLSETAVGHLQRIAAVSEDGFDKLILQWLDGHVQPEATLSNLERLLAASHQPRLISSVLMDAPAMGRWILLLLGSSQRLTEALIQNPEFLSLLLEPTTLSIRPTVEGIEEEGRRLLSVASGYTHGLDRLRLLKQSWNLKIAINDLTGNWSQSEVWAALADLAQALIRLASKVAWDEYCSQKDVHESNPLSIIGFGKLGGRELNYSSDVDLVYVMADGATEAMERHAVRYGELLGRALSDSMGRGSLFRVDLRLRPFGGAGFLTPSMLSVESYYRSHAEEWEIQALLKSRVLADHAVIAGRWDAMRDQHCFRPSLSQAAVDAMLAMRDRVEAHAEDGDLKRGAGGIRDIEFLVQALQRAHGFSEPKLRQRSTLDVLAALGAAQYLDEEVVKVLSETYTFYRKLEHRLQLEDRQTHSIPRQPEQRSRLAQLMGYDGWPLLEVEIDQARKRVRELYRSLLDPSLRPPMKAQALEKVGAHAATVEAWVDSIPESEVFYQSLVENSDSAYRMIQVIEHAPALIPSFRKSVALTEQLLSGEIEEESNFEQLDSVAPGAPSSVLAASFRSEWVRLATQAAVGDRPIDELPRKFQDLFDLLLNKLHRRVQAEFAIVALGSFAAQELTIGSDLDLLLLVGDELDQKAAEAQAVAFLKEVAALRQLECPVQIDLRLRPDGGKGLLVRTYSAFRYYAVSGMDMWERLALGQCRPVIGPDSAFDLAVEIAYGLPLTPSRLDELLAMKLRIETERVNPKYARRNVKLGIGGLSDFEWFIRLHELRYPTATHAGKNFAMLDRLRALREARLVHLLEHQALEEAFLHLTRVRTQLALLDMERDVLPENPDKLDRIGRTFGFVDGNAFLARHEEIIEGVRSIYNEGIERLRA